MLLWVKPPTCGAVRAVGALTSGRLLHGLLPLKLLLLGSKGQFSSGGGGEPLQEPTRSGQAVNYPSLLNPRESQSIQRGPEPNMGLNEL